MNPGLQMSVSAERFVARGSVQTPSSAHSSAHGLKKTFWKSLKSKRKKKWRAVQRHRKRLRTTPALNPWARGQLNQRIDRWTRRYPTTTAVLFALLGLVLLWLAHRGAICT